MTALAAAGFVTPDVLRCVGMDRRPAAAPRWRLLVGRQMRIERWDARRDGPLSETTLRQKLEARGYTCALQTYPAGAAVAVQAAGEELVEAVVTGLLKLTIDSEAAILTAGDIVLVPGGAMRRLEVVGGMTVQCLEGTRASFG